MAEVKILIYVTVDGGTTNTRAKLWQGNRVIAGASLEIGVKDTAITGSKYKLQQGVKEVIELAVKGAGIDREEVTVTIASGMITSNLGLFELAHISAPAGIDDLAQAMVCMRIPEVSEQPIWFIPGIKNGVAEITVTNCEQMDMMRGEEVETIGLIQRLGLKEETVCVLPGSHTKFIGVDSAQRITGCLTTLAGELLGVITRNTILADAVNNSYASTINAEMLVEGARFSERVGLGRTCFSLRILDRFTNLTVDEKANFLLGAMLGTDLVALKNSTALQIRPETPVVIMGKKILTEAFAMLFQNDRFFKGEIQALPDEQFIDIAGYGAAIIARRRGILS
jgi:2-dehydro-3-deoxygalactonokinase